MKHTRYNAIVYERPGPVSDMFVPHRVLISLVAAPPPRASKFVSALLFLIAVLALLHQGGTFSYFSDIEASTNNTFVAGQLDFTVSSDHSSATLVAGQTDEIFVITVVPVAGSLPFRYRVIGTATGSPPFCAAITAFGRAPLPFSSSAASISTSDTDSLAPWSLILTLPSGTPDVVDGQICTLDLAFQGYQEGGVAGTEYHDTEHVILTLTADPPADLLSIVAPQNASDSAQEVVVASSTPDSKTEEASKTEDESPIEETASPALWESATTESVAEPSLPDAPA